jgi:formate dehydrogenase major subunit
MTPHKHGGANEGHSCVKGRFAWGYATHPDRITKPDDPKRHHRSLARGLLGRGDGHAARRVPPHPGRSMAAMPSAPSSSSAAPMKKSYLVQKLVRAAFGNNNIDTCARVCHSPTGYGLKPTFGTSAGTQDFRSPSKRPTSSW